MKIDKLYTLALVLLALIIPAVARSQQQVMFTQYMFNSLAINPAYAGSHEGISLTGLARKQWTGLEGAPSTQTLSAHGALRNEKVGLGLLLLNDKIGVTHQTGVYASYAYRLQFGQSRTLAMGVQGGVNYFTSRFSEVSTTDPAFAGQDVKEWQPSVGFGLYYYTDRFYAGASIPQFNENLFTKREEYSYLNLIRHYFVSAGYVLDLNHSLKLKPNVLLKIVEGAPVEVDLNANLLIREVLWVGASWRSFDSVDALFQLQLTENLQLGYAYDFATSRELRSINAGSHELMLNYRFGTRNSKIITPRYF